MIIENGSDWRTDDLRNLVERVKTMPKYGDGYRIYSDTLLLFRMGNPKTKKDYKGEPIEPPAAVYDRDEKRWTNTVVVKIRSRCQLKMEVLDALAHIGKDFEQDMPGKDVVLLAKEIAKAIATYAIEYGDYSWAQTMSMRSKDSRDHCPISLEREIEALENQKDNILRRARKSTDKIDAAIRELRQTI